MASWLSNAGVSPISLVAASAIVAAVAAPSQRGAGWPAHHPHGLRPLSAREAFRSLEHKCDELTTVPRVQVVAAGGGCQPRVRAAAGHRVATPRGCILPVPWGSDTAGMERRDGARRSCRVGEVVHYLLKDDLGHVVTVRRCQRMVLVQRQVPRRPARIGVSVRRRDPSGRRYRPPRTRRGGQPRPGGRSPRATYRMTSRKRRATIVGDSARPDVTSLRSALTKGIDRPRAAAAHAAS